MAEDSNMASRVEREAAKSGALVLPIPF